MSLAQLQPQLFSSIVSVTQLVSPSVALLAKLVLILNSPLSVVYIRNILFSETKELTAENLGSEIQYRTERGALLPLKYVEWCKKNFGPHFLQTYLGEASLFLYDKIWEKFSIRPPGWDISREPGSQAPTKSLDSHKIFAANHAVLVRI